LRFQTFFIRHEVKTNLRGMGSSEGSINLTLGLKMHKNFIASAVLSVVSLLVAAPTAGLTVKAENFLQT
jgi:hypothetical protein